MQTKSTIYQTAGRAITAQRRARDIFEELGDERLVAFSDRIELELEVIAERDRHRRESAYRCYYKPHEPAPYEAIDAVRAKVVEARERSRAQLEDCVREATSKAMKRPDPKTSIVLEDLQSADGQRAKGHHAEVWPRRRVRIFGGETNAMFGPADYDRTYELGEIAACSMAKLTKLGYIMAIGPERIRLIDEYDSRDLTYYEFSFLNRRMDAQEIIRHNSELWLEL